MHPAELNPGDGAGRHARQLGSAAGLFGTMAAIAMFAFRSDDVAAAMSDALGASLTIVCGGCASAAILAYARAAAVERRHDVPRSPNAAKDGADDRARRGVRAGWLQVVVGGPIAAIAVGAAVPACGRRAVWTQSPNDAAAGAAVLLATAFALLVLERHLAALDERDLPEAPALAALARVPIAVSTIGGLGCLLLYAGIGLGARAGQLAALPCLAVAGEMAVRAVIALFLPHPALDRARMTTRSAIAGAIGLHPLPPAAAALRDLVGIDLSRGWALAFLRAALLPVLAVLALFGWSLSGIDALRLDQRGIYERFGRPVAVLGPGLHLHLPWPIGRVRPVELGVVHDVPIVSDVAGADGMAPVPEAEADPGPDVDRLWSGARATEGTYLVASLSRGQQSFESIDVDLRVVYRVGLSEASAVQAAFVVSDPRRLVQARASRLVSRHLASRTLSDMLGADRAAFGRAIAAELQDELDASRTGLEVMAVLVDAIHPPAGAAEAYHAVQAARIGVYTAVAEERGDSAQSALDARRDATNIENAAIADAHDATIDAEIRSISFAADRAADAREPASFLLERRLDRLGAGLAHRRALIVDHRLQGAAGPLLDLRPSAGAGLPAQRDPRR